MKEQEFKSIIESVKLTETEEIQNEKLRFTMIFGEVSVQYDYSLN